MEYDKTMATDFSQVVDDIKQIINTGKSAAYAAVDATMIAYRPAHRGRGATRAGTCPIRQGTDKDARQGTDARVR